LIRDFFAGFMILVENQYSVGHVIRIGSISGAVEDISLRTTVLRDEEGVVHFIPHGQITTVSNLSYGWSRVAISIGVAYQEDVDRVMQVLMDVARQLAQDETFGRDVIDEPQMLGVDALGDSSVAIKFLLKTRPLRQWAVKRELLRRIKLRFDELGIEIPFPQRVIHMQAAEQPAEYDRLER
jgi:small conductance mechanosensitive channel